MSHNMDWSDHVAHVGKILFTASYYKFRGIDLKRGLWRQLRDDLRKKYPDALLVIVTARMFKYHTDEDEEKNPIDYLAGRGKGKKAAGIAVLSAERHPHLIQAYMDQRQQEVNGNFRNIRPFVNEQAKIEGSQEHEKLDEPEPEIGTFRWMVKNQQKLLASAKQSSLRAVT